MEAGAGHSARISFYSFSIPFNPHHRRFEPGAHLAKVETAADIEKRIEQHPQA